jgi:hypothetical protein
VLWAWPSLSQAFGESFVEWPSGRLFVGKLLCDSQCAGVVVLPSQAVENLLALLREYCSSSGRYYFGRV